MNLHSINKKLKGAGCRRVEVSPDGRFLLWMEDSRLIQTYLKTDREVSVAAAPDENGFCVSACSAFMAVASDTSVCVYSSDDGDLVTDMGIERPVSIPPGVRALTPAGSDLIAKRADRPGWAKIYLETGEEIGSFGSPEADEGVTCGGVSADGSRLILAGGKGMMSEGFLAEFDTETGELKNHSALPYEVDRIAVSPNGNKITILDHRGICGEDWIFDDQFEQPISDVQYILDGDELLCMTLNGTLFRLDSEDGSLIKQTDLPANDVIRMTAPDYPDFVALHTKQGVQLIETGG